MQSAKEIQQELEQYIDPVKREYLPRFFKTGKGQYGEGDKFLGVVIPNTRSVAKRHKDAPFEVMATLLQSEWHECRLCALLMLVERFKKSDEKGRKLIYDFYLSQTSRINNWDLVDLSAPGIVGEYLKDKPREDLYRLAGSTLLWEQRIAVVSTYTFIKNRDFIDIIRLSEGFIAHSVHTGAHNSAHSLHTGAHKPAHSFSAGAHCVQPLHDLMQKAIGWMLREMGKRDKDLLVQFLEKHCKTMPGTALRYAIEKFPEEERQEFMKR
jgi:3-methyladenine DNA glycosylase AlkD